MKIILVKIVSELVCRIIVVLWILRPVLAYFEPLSSHPHFVGLLCDYCFRFSLPPFFTYRPSIDRLLIFANCCPLLFLIVRAVSAFLVSKKFTIRYYKFVYYPFTTQSATRPQPVRPASSSTLVTGQSASFSRAKGWKESFDTKGNKMLNWLACRPFGDALGKFTKIEARSSSRSPVCVCVAIASFALPCNPNCPASSFARH